jgi:hypothetical protein
MEDNFYNIYCDESSIDNPDRNFMSIGALFVRRNLIPEIKKKIKEIQNKYYIKGELKWKKTSEKTLEFYKELFDYLFSLPHSSFSFKAIVIDKNKINYKKYHNEDRELAFYKFYYFLLKNSLGLNNLYYIFLDFRPNKNKNSVRRLKEFLSFTNNNSIKWMQAYPSEDNIFIQISDILTGAVAYYKNKEKKNGNKKELTQIIAKSIGKNNLDFCSELKEKKFNIFCINLNNK